MADRRPMRVIIESPYAGDRERNVAYARACMLDSLRRGEAPFGSHLLYTQVLRDEDAGERAAGMAAGFAWGEVAERVVAYVDYGLSPGMALGLELAKARGVPVEQRTLGTALPALLAEIEAQRESSGH